MLIRKRLTSEEFSPPNLRYDAECDCVQFTPDGTTWVDQPANDPRTSDAYRLPAGDDQCEAAEGMRALVQSFVDERLAVDNELEIAGGILGIVAFIPGFNVLWALILAFAALAVTIARELLEAAFTTEIYDQIRCTFFCHISANGQMSQAQFDAAYAEFDDDSLYPDVITQLWIHAVMDLVGPVGMSDAGVKLAAAADCGTCACGWCRHIDFTLTDGGFTAFVNMVATYGTWVSGTGWRSAYFAAPSYDNVQDVIICLAFTEANLTSIHFDVTYLNSTAPHADLFSDCALSEYVTAGADWDGNEGWNAIQINAYESSCTSIQYVIVTGCTIQGTGDIPPELDIATGITDCS